jgi:hypothetical protein
MKNEIKTAAWEIDRIWGNVQAGKSTTSLARQETKVAIIRTIVNTQILTHTMKKKLLKDAGFVSQSEYARRTKVSRQSISKNIISGWSYPMLRYKGRVYMYSAMK